MAGDLLTPGRHVAELEQIRDAPVVRLQLGVSVAGLACGGDHLVGDGQSLLDAVGAPQRHMPRAEGGGERARIAGGAGRCDGVGAQRVRACAVGRVVELDCEARLHAGA